MFRSIISVLLLFLPVSVFAQIAADTAVSINQPYADTNLCAGNTLSIAYSVSNTYSSGNIFTVQLSNASGSFASPTNIGSISATTSSNISCTIPSNTPTGTGYRIRVIASNPADTSANNGVNILISNLSSLSISSNNPVCYSDSLVLDAVDTSTGVSFNWSGPNSFGTTVQNITIPLVTYTDSGMYHVTATLNACSKTDSIHVIVKQLPAIPTVGSNSPICLHDSLHLAASDTTSGVSYGWTGPNFFSSLIQNPGIGNAPLSDSGWYYVTVTGSNGCHAGDSVFVTVKPLPALPTANSNSPVCSGDSLLLSANDTTSGVFYSWSGPNGFSAVSQNPSIVNVSLAAAGFYNVTVFLNGCSVAVSLQVSINLSPNLPTIGSNSPLCVGNTLNLNSTSTTNGVTFYWEGPGGFTDSTQNPSINNVQMSDSGVFKIYTRLGSCYSDTNGIIVTVNPIVSPFVSISTNPPVISFGTPIQFIANIINGGPFPSVQWRRNGIDIPGYTVNPCYITLATGDIISVIVYSDAPCPVPDTAVSNGVTAGVGSLQLGAGNWELYPNPCNGSFNLSLSEGKGIAGNGITTLEILNTLGQIVYAGNAKIENGILKKEIVLDVPNGVYIVRLDDDKGNSRLKQLVISR